MKVSLINYTGIGTVDPSRFAAEQLIFTKQTRLQMTPTLMDEIRLWPYEKVIEELQYMANTIPSSWEFVDYTFLIEGVTRAFTHQLVRTRTASFAQQTMRVLDVTGWDYLTGPTISKNDVPIESFKSGDDYARSKIYHDCMRDIAIAYEGLLKNGATIEDARGVLPTNILTNIVMKINMRNFVELVQKRSSSRVQGEYRDVLEAMKAEVNGVHPWIALFIERTFDRAADELDEAIRSLNIDNVQRTNMIKLLDQMRSKQ